MSISDSRVCSWHWSILRVKDVILLWIRSSLGARADEPIAIDRSVAQRRCAASRAAAASALEQDSGWWCFRGTRVAPARGANTISAAPGSRWRAARRSCRSPQRGLLWPRNAFVKRPGVVTVPHRPRSTPATATRKLSTRSPNHGSKSSKGRCAPAASAVRPHRRLQLLSSPPAHARITSAPMASPSPAAAHDGRGAGPPRAWRRSKRSLRRRKASIRAMACAAARRRRGHRRRR